MRILVTGAAGFIGFHVSLKLLERGDDVVGIDNLNDYYDPTLKESRLAVLAKMKRFVFHKVDIADQAAIGTFFREQLFDRVIHLAAQAGVRYSVTNPQVYIDSNIQGFINILEGCRHSKIHHLVYASSSSVYGANESIPFSVHDNVDHPVSLYAATKKSNELMAHCYSHLYGLPTTGLRFFTVYGPWGRPDMALFLFTKAILEDRPIDVYNHGEMFRDFTYVGDVVEGIIRVCDNVAQPNSAWSGKQPDPATSRAPYRIYNIGNHAPVKLMDFIAEIERATGKTAQKNYLPMQPGDVSLSFADVQQLVDDLEYHPATPIADGVTRFVAWYRNYYRC